MITQTLITVTPEALTAAVVAGVREALAEALQPKPTDVLVARKQLANELGVSLPTLWKHTRSGKLKAHRIGSRVLYNRAEVLAALAGTPAGAKAQAQKGGRNG